MLVYGRSTAAPHVRKIKKSRRGPFFPILYPRHPKRRQSPHSQAPPVPAIASQIAGFKVSTTQNDDVCHPRKPCLIVTDRSTALPRASKGAPHIRTM